MFFFAVEAGHALGDVCLGAELFLQFVLSSGKCVTAGKRVVFAEKPVVIIKHDQLRYKLLVCFCKQFNEATKDMVGDVVPAEITIYEDRSFSFILKTPPVSDMIKKALNIQKGAANALKEKKGKLTKVQVREIAEKKMQDLNTTDIEAAARIIAGTARSMGVEVES